MSPVSTPWPSSPTLHGNWAFDSRSDGPGNAGTNALAESFFATIKGELLEHRSWQSHAAARAAIFDYIESWYNIRRRHSALGYLSPTAYEATAATIAA